MIRSRMAEQLMRRGMLGRVRQANAEPAGPGHWMASRSAGQTILNYADLPDDVADGNLQNADGEYLFLADYSIIGGGDVLA